MTNLDQAKEKEDSKTIFLTWTLPLNMGFGEKKTGKEGDIYGYMETMRDRRITFIAFVWENILGIHS